MGSTCFEYKFIEGNTTLVQTKLNQWRHIYEMNILFHELKPNGELIILIERRKKCQSR
jgi:hypothetical protein